MDAEFGGRQLKDQPAIGRVVALDGIPAEHVAQCLAQPLSLARVEEHVRADDRHAVMLRLECGISPRVRTFAVTGRSSSLEPASFEGTFPNTRPCQVCVMSRPEPTSRHAVVLSR